MHGPLTLAALSQTVGNHEFDNGPTGDAGLEGFARNISGAFPVLSCNLDISGQPALQGLVQRYALVELERSGATVGIMGLTSVDTPETSSPGKDGGEVGGPCCGPV